MKRFLLTALFVLICSFAFAQELIIVVAPFDIRAGSGFSAVNCLALPKKS
jgi:hypothetical protein